MPTSTVEHHRWSEVAAEAINPFITRRYLMGDRITVSQLELKRGGVVAVHTHENEQVSLVISGALTFQIEGREIVVRAGEALVIPGNVPHGVDVLEDTLVIDVFTPIRQDWIDKTDTYFGR
jgi:quercetin dioxygenase-like cupin family protein